MSKRYDSAKAREYYLANRERILERQRVYRETHREECNARSRAARQANPEPAARHARAQAERFRDMREEMARSQDFMCPCGEPLGDERALDHDHSCCDKTVRNSCRECDRGVMHHRCNLLLSMVGDDPAKLRNLADYLEFHKITRDSGNDGEAGSREPRGDSPDSPAPGEARVPGDGDPVLSADASADYARVPYRSVSLSPAYVSPDCVTFHEVPEGADIQEFTRQLRANTGEDPSEKIPEIRPKGILPYRTIMPYDLVLRELPAPREWRPLRDLLAGSRSDEGSTS